MKKFFLFLLAGIMAAGASAQVVTSRTMVKTSKPTMWYGRIGLSLNNVAGGSDYVKDWDDASIGPRAGMSIDFGFQRPAGSAGMYWGMELGIGTRGGSMSEEYVSEDYFGSNEYQERSFKNKGRLLTWNVKYSPFTFGYKYSLTDDIKIDGHIGAFVSYDFAGKAKWSWEEDDEEESSSISDMKDYVDFQCFDAGMQLGVGIWWKRFNFDFTWQRGFVTGATVYDYDHDKDLNLTSSNFMFRVGYAF